MIKDGGDDPDVTHGAEVIVRVRRIDEPGVHILGGPGVGTITQPGLELPPGSPAINPVPRRMIAEGVAIALGTGRPEPGVEVVGLGPGRRGAGEEDAERADRHPRRNLDPGDDRRRPAR